MCKFYIVESKFLLMVSISISRPGRITRHLRGTLWCLPWIIKRRGIHNFEIYKKSTIRSYIILKWYRPIRAECLIQVQLLIPRGLLYLISCFHLCWNNILSVMYVDWGPPHLSLVVCYILHLVIPPPCKTWHYKECNKNYKNLVLDVIRTPGTSNQTIYYNLQNICFSS